jgi:hypothetical protein
MTYTVATPMAFSGSLGALPAASCLLSTVIFTYLPDAAVFNSPQVMKNNEMGGGYSQLTGKWYPQSRLVLDGLGRLVGDDERTDPPSVWGWG